MTSWEIWERAKKEAEKLQLRDVWHLLKEFQAHGYVTCLSGTNGNGAVYYWTVFGRKQMATNLNCALLPAPKEIVWEHFSFVKRGAVRRAVVKELARPVYNFQAETTASQLRKQMLDSFPLSLHGLLRTLKQLTERGIISCAHSTSGKRIYSLTPQGHRIVELLRTESFVHSTF